jgi:iron complex transport system substrate-binding protein
MWRTRLTRAAVPLLAALVLAACGSGPASDTASETAPADGTITVKHTFGTSTLPRTPERVVTLTSRDTDTALALGVVPVGIHTVYRFETGVGPWAQDLLGTARPPVWRGSDFDFEAIAAVRPDVILWANGDDDVAVYDRLAGIAPTIGLPKGQVAYGATVESSTTLVAQALGRPAEGQRLLDDLGAHLKGVAAANPRFGGLTATYADIAPSGMFAYPDEHVVNTTLAALGFRMTAGSTGIAGASQPVSPERLADYAADVMVVYPFDRTLPELEQQVPTLASLDAARNGRLFVLPDLAFSASSVLSLRSGVDRLVPEIARTLGGQA